MELVNPHVIVLGNQKGGTGKSTTAMHIIVSLLKASFKVGSIDVDARQGTLSRYIQNRLSSKETASHPDHLHIQIPLHIALLPSEAPTSEEARKADEENFAQALFSLKDVDFIVIDTPGSELYLSRIAHSFADTLITPINDSFLDLDVIAHVSPDLNTVRPSVYADWVFEQKKRRAIRDHGTIDWIVLRNRLTNLRARNKENMERVLSLLSKRLGFRQVSGFGERVVFRELFLSGLTLFDIKSHSTEMSISHVAARQELRCLLEALNLPSLKSSREEVA